MPCTRSITSGAYPEGTVEAIRAKADCTVLDAGAIAAKLGNPRAMNIVLLGALILSMGLEKQLDWNAIVAAKVKPQFVELNQKALAAGMEV